MKKGDEFMERDQVLEWIGRGEGQTVEFKESASTTTTRAAIKTLAAFGSQSQGGVVIFGVRDNGNLHPGFHLGRETSAQLSGSIKAVTVSMTTGEPLLPVIWTFSSPDLMVAQVLPEVHLGGPYLAFDCRWQRSGAATHLVRVDYRQLARAYQKHLKDDPDPIFGIGFCPDCGERDFTRSSHNEPDSVYYRIECNRCHWTDWTE
ncbi:ATP-binding protein [Nocardia sp. CDC153]|uniref:AlbA family DNA-binding domain-containing protein n=1 Tax=Nocardia sp. CDC153 TaxID=3112167 RepID=UPI002DB654EE|nr:ATP-binding protein [Nocardia sp. CDC153]MEC3952865.1 ATP-binding protein [Nocardia sp. CDC153]